MANSTLDFKSLASFVDRVRISLAMMDQPGFSLFQGSDSIHINERATEAAEEAEDLLDKKRRDEELKEQLQNAFDDLNGDEDDDEYDETMDNSRRSGISQGIDVEQLKGDYQLHGDKERDLYRLRIELQSKTNELNHVGQVSTVVQWWQRSRFNSSHPLRSSRTSVKRHKRPSGS